MRVGILTFSAAHNFGAVLQCYALYATFLSLGYDVTLIDYRPSYLATYRPIFGWRQMVSRHLLSLPQRWCNYRYWRGIYDRYVGFEQDNMRLTPPCYNVAQLRVVTQSFDYVVVGSDQVWNPKFNGRDSAWYGFKGAGNPKWITYAASAGGARFSEDEKGYLTTVLQNFSRLSVREDELRDILKPMLRGDEYIPTVLDPSLLADPSIWQKWQKSILKDEYIITYQARKSDEVFRIAREVSEQMGGVKIIPIDLYDNVEANGYKTYIASPSEFISLICNARCVITTSFHGTAFSIINKTPFYTVRLNDGADGRAENLLQQIGLSDRMIDVGMTPIFTTIEFENAHVRLEELRNSSLDFLKNALV